METIKTDRIKLSDLGYYVRDKGVEHGDSLSKVILVDFDGNGSYVNPFCIEEAYPVFKRAPYSNETPSGVTYGTKLFPVSEDLVTGPCWGLCSDDFSETFGKEQVSLEELEDWVLSSSDFYKDRIAIAKRRLKSSPFKRNRILRNDQPLVDAMNEFFSGRECGVQMVKEY